MLNPISLTLAAARQIIFAAETKAFQLASPSTIAVVDISGQLIAYVRMDGARLDPDRQSTQKALDVLAALHRWCTTPIMLTPLLEAEPPPLGPTGVH
jgi:uncharacterized protein GlcG (DUF336 family)